MLQDLRYGLRTLGKAPGFTTIAVIALALGIGANSAMFSIVNTVLLRPIPYPTPERVLMLYTSMPQFDEASVSYPNFLDWQQRSRSFEHLAAFRSDTFHLTGDGNPERLRGHMASSTFFAVMGAQAIAGRVFTADEDRKGAAPVAVLTSDLWRTRFAGDPGVIGRTMILNEHVYTIVGVVASDNVLLDRTSVLVPIGQWSEPLFWDRGVGMGTRVVGRLKPGISTAQAQAELDAVAAALAREYPQDNKDRGIHTLTLHEDLVGDVRKPLLVLFAAVGLVLLIACANVANLLLARASARQREFAIRGALGATRHRLARQLLTEGLLLATAGGALGLALAAGVSTVFASRLATQLPRAGQVHLDASVLIFTALVSLLASLLFGITPALQGTGGELNRALKESGRGTSGRHGFQRALVVVEVALALVLTTSAGLMIRTVSRLMSVNPGFDPENVLTMGIAGTPAVHGTPEAVRNGFSHTLEQLRAVPGVEAASVIFGGMPMGGDSELPYWVEGRPKPAEQSQMEMALFYGVDPEYQKVMRIPVLRGRFPTAQDNNENRPCAIAIDEEFARSVFPGQEPIGHHVNLALISMKCEIVGVVGHVKHWGLDRDDTAKIRAQMYIPFRQFPDSVMDMASTGTDYLVRTSGEPYAVVPALKRTVTGINGKMVMYGGQSMPDLIADSMSARTLTRLLLGTFALLALALAGVGIYGVVSYHVTQTTHEIGVRMALGADGRKVLGMVLGGAMRMALLGIVAGAVAAFAVTRVMTSLLYGVSPADPLTFASVAVVLTLVTLLASYIPARRAVRVDPMVALRYE